MFNMSLNWSDTKIMREVINQGIDSRLEGFTRSTFVWNHNTGKMDCQIHPEEMTTLIRRLLELETESAEMLADDIVYVEYGHETI